MTFQTVSSKSDSASDELLCGTKNVRIYIVSQKNAPHSCDDNFVKSEPIFTILSLLEA